MSLDKMCDAMEAAILAEKQAGRMDSARALSAQYRNFLASEVARRRRLARIWLWVAATVNTSVVVVVATRLGT